MKFFGKSKKSTPPVSAAVSTPDIASSSSDSKTKSQELLSASGGSSLNRNSLRASSDSLNVNHYAYPSIKEKNLKDIFKAVWSDDFVKVRNSLAKNKTKPDARDNEKRSPLHLAAVKGNQAIMQLLMQKNFNINAVDSHGATPLIKAVQNKHEMMVQMLFSAKPAPDTEVRDRDGLGAIHYAVRLNWSQGLKHLLKNHGTNPNLADNDGNTALHIACENNYLSICSVLLAQRADANVQNRNLKTPLILAAEQGYGEVVSALVEGGHAEVLLKDADGWTACDRAQMNGYKDIHKYLKGKENEMQGGRHASSSNTLEGENEEERQQEEGKDTEVDEEQVGESASNPPKEHNGHKEKKDTQNNGNDDEDADARWFGSDSESEDDSEGINISKSANNKVTSESLSPEKDEVENGPDPQLSPRQLSDGFGSFDDDDSLSLNFGNNKREKSKPVLTNYVENGDTTDGKTAGEASKPNRIGSFGSLANNVIGRTISEIDDDSHWGDTDTELKSHADKEGEMNNPKSTHTHSSDVKIVANGKAHLDYDESEDFSFGTDKNSLQPIGKGDKDKEYPLTSTYFDSSEDETAAQDELEKQRQREKAIKSTEQLPHNDDDRFFEGEDVKEIEKGEKISTNVDAYKVSATLTAEEATPVSAMYEQEEEDADSMDWDSDVSESEDKRKTEGGVGGSNVPVEANVVVQNSPSQDIMRPPSASPFDSEEEEEDNDKNKDQKKGERAVETGNMYEKANSTMDNSRVSTASDNENNPDKAKQETKPEYFSKRTTGELNLDVIGTKAAKVDSTKLLSTKDKKDTNIEKVSLDVMGRNVQQDNSKSNWDDDEEDEVDRTETISSWEIENRNRRQKQDKPEDKSNNVLQEVLEDSLVNVDWAENNENKLEAGVGELGDDMLSTRNEKKESESEDEIEVGFKAGMSTSLVGKEDSSVNEVKIAENVRGGLSSADVDGGAGGGSLLIPSVEGGGDRIPSTPFPSKNIDNRELKVTSNAVDNKAEDQDMIESSLSEESATNALPNGANHEDNQNGVVDINSVKKKTKSEDGVIMTSEEEDDDAMDGEEEADVSSKSALFSPRLLDLKKQVTSSSGLVGLKNQFRQQRRDLEREQMERKDSERRAHTFQQQVQQLQLKVQNLNKEKEASEEEILQLKSELKALQQQLEQEMENRQLNEQLLSQRATQLGKVERELTREVGEREEAQRQVRQLQMQLNEAHSKLKSAEHLYTLNSPRAVSRNESLHSHHNSRADQSRASGTGKDLMGTDDTSLAHQLEENLAEQNNLHEQIDELTNKNVQLSHQLEERSREKAEMENGLHRLKGDMQRLQEEKAKLMDDLAAEKADRKELSAKFESERQNSADKLIAQDKLESLREDLAAKTQVVQRLESEVEAKRDQIEELRTQLHNTQMDNTRITAELTHIQQQINSEKEKHEETIGTLKKEKEELAAQLKIQTASWSERDQNTRGETDRHTLELQETLSECRRDLAIAEARLKDQEELRRMSQEEVLQLKKEVDSLRKQVDSLLKKNSDVEVRNSELSIKLSILEEMREKQPDTQQKKAAFKNQTKQSQLGGGPGGAEEGEEQFISMDLSQGRQLESGVPLQYGGVSNLDQLVGAQLQGRTSQAKNNQQLQGLENEIEAKRANNALHQSQQPYLNQSAAPNLYHQPPTHPVQTGADLANQSQLSNQSMTMSPPNMAAGVGVGVGGGNLWASLEQYRREIEAQCRLEFNEKMAQVKTHLDEQNSWLSNIERDRSEQEHSLKREYNRRISDLEMEIRKYKELYGVTIPIRDSRDFHASPTTAQGSGSGLGTGIGIGMGDDPELKRLHSLLEKERKQREKLESKLEKMVDRDIDARAHLLAERQRTADVSSASHLSQSAAVNQSNSRRNYLNLNHLSSSAAAAGGHTLSTPVSHHAHGLRTSSEFDAVLERVKQKLDSSISRHLGTTKLELELFGQHPYAAWDKGANHSGSLYGSSAGNFGSLNRHRHPRYTGGASLNITGGGVK